MSKYCYNIQDHNTPSASIDNEHGRGYDNIGEALQAAVDSIAALDDAVLRTADIQVRVDAEDDDGYATEPTIVFNLDEFKRAFVPLRDMEAA